MSPNLPIRQIAQEDVNTSSIIAVTLGFIVTLVPHFLHLPVWVIGFALFTFSWRVFQSTHQFPALPRWLLVPLVVVGGLSVFAEFWTIVGRDAGLALLTVMSSFKFLESKTHRDILLLVFLSYFLLATHFLFGQSIFIAVYMFITLIIITATLITINQRDSTVPIKTRLLASMRLLGLSIPVMIILFILVPRIPGPLWGLTQEQRGGITGLSDSMSPGSISDLITSNDVAFRVTFSGDIPPQELLYWRGPVMTNFNGTTWQQGASQRINSYQMANASAPIEYTITLEPHGKKWLFGLDMPIQTPANSNMTSEFQLVNAESINDMKRYSLQSRLQYQVGLSESLDYLLMTNELPSGRNPRTIALGEQWSQQFTQNIDIVNHALSMFRQQEFSYTLQPPLLGKNPSDDFLFETRRGFCEHYASSFALLMRAAGIPSRIVTGYQGGEINQVGEYLMVRQSDAHAWTEVWLEDRGWMRVDPTAAVSPDRIENGLDQALDEAVTTFKIGKRNPLLTSLLYNWDNLQHSWNDMILNYDHRKQSHFLRQLGVGIQSWGDMVIALVFCLILVTGMFWFVSWYRDRPAAPPVYEKIINQLLKKLARSGMPKKANEDVFEYLQRLKQEQQFEDPDLHSIFKTYSKIKYAKGFQKEQILQRFQQLVSEWKISI